MHPKWHITSSMIIAMISLLFEQNTPFLSIQLFHREISVFVLCFVVGVTIDVDHLIDYHVYRRYTVEGENMIILFHGIENVAILAFLSFVFQFPFIVFPSISYACHMAMDVYGNGQPFLSYCYVVRFGRRLLGLYAV